MESVCCPRKIFFEFGREKIRNEPDTGSYCKNWRVGEVNSELVGAFFGFIVENPYPEIDYENEPDWWILFLELEKIPSGSWLLQAISILPEHRGKGLAKEFLAKTDEVARSEGVTNITLQVEEINYIALKTYKSYGYPEIARKKLIPFSFSDDTGDIVLMGKAIYIFRYKLYTGVSAIRAMYFAVKDKEYPSP